MKVYIQAIATVLYMNATECTGTGQKDKNQPGSTNYQHLVQAEKNVMLYM